MKNYPDFERTLCEKWHLPCRADQGKADFVTLPLVTMKLPTSTNDPPSLAWTPKEADWGEGPNRIWVQTDNQQVAAIFAGQSVLKGTDLRPPCIRIARLLHRLLAMGHRPRRDIAPSIEWDPRELNGVADHAANCALDLAAAWETHGGGNAYKIEGCNIRICVDGARRGNGQASGGMAVFAYEADGSRSCLYRSGVVFGVFNSAFTAGVLAMEWTLESFLKKFVGK